MPPAGPASLGLGRSYTDVSPGTGPGAAHSQVAQVTKDPVTYGRGLSSTGGEVAAGSQPCRLAGAGSRHSIMCPQHLAGFQVLG